MTSATFNAISNHAVAFCEQPPAHCDPSFFSSLMEWCCHDHNHHRQQSNASEINESHDVSGRACTFLGELFRWDIQNYCRLCKDGGGSQLRWKTVSPKGNMLTLLLFSTPQSCWPALVSLPEPNWSIRSTRVNKTYFSAWCTYVHASPCKRTPAPIRIHTDY